MIAKAPFGWALLSFRIQPHSMMTEDVTLKPVRQHKPYWQTALLWFRRLDEPLHKQACNTIVKHSGRWPGARSALASLSRRKTLNPTGLPNWPPDDWIPGRSEHQVLGIRGNGAMPHIILLGDYVIVIEQARS